MSEPNTDEWVPDDTAKAWFAWFSEEVWPALRAERIRWLDKERGRHAMTRALNPRPGDPPVGNTLDDYHRERRRCRCGAHNQ